MKNYLLFFTFLIITVFACKTSMYPEKLNKIALTFETKSNSRTKGTAYFIEKKGIVYFTAKLNGLTPGTHAIHIHEKSDCSAIDGSSAGGHWNPTFKKHGKWGSQEHHKGDIGNFEVKQNGTASIEFKTDQWCIGCDDETKNIVNKSVIIHQGADDYTSQPAGNAGARIACTAIIK